MLFWAFIVAAAILAGLWLAWPYLRSRSVEMSGADAAISIYRDQLDEVERDHDAGLISAAECDAARLEIERRALAAARQLDQGLAISGRSFATAAVVIFAVAGLTLGTYAALGLPGAGDQPLAQRRTEALTRRADAGDIGSRIELLIEKTRENPESFEDWWMLARSYSAVGDDASAVEAYRHAVELSGDRPAVLSAYAEAMTLANGNKVPGAAQLIFEQLAADGGDPRARYYLALSKAQAQDFQGAIDGWAALAQNSQPDAPWMPLIRRDIVNMARFLDQDVTAYLPDATPAEIATAGGGGLVPQTAGNRIADLEAALDADPMDYKAWIALAQARVESGDSEAAAEAMARARRHYAAAPFVLQKFDEAERALGLDLVAAAPRGPTRDDIAAASDMTQQERDDMIDGMVSGLAARLEENPDNPDGWVMLIRSYATLGHTAKARSAYDTALQVFDGRDAVLQAIRNQTASVLPPD